MRQPAREFKKWWRRDVDCFHISRMGASLSAANNCAPKANSMTGEKPSARVRPIPTSEDWAGYEADIDARYAHKVAFGKSNEEMQELYDGARALSRAEDLRFMPRRAFQYYIFGFTQFLSSETAREDADAASSFLELLIGREEIDPGSVMELFEELEPVIRHVASNQEYYRATIDIYGRFEDLEQKLLSMRQAYKGR